MARYFTFFFYSRKAVVSRDILNCVDWLANALPLAGRLHVVAREAQTPAGSRPVLQGDFARNRDKLGELSLATLNVSSLERTSAGTEFFFRFESTALRSNPEKEAAGPHQPTLAQAYLPFTTITFSLRSDLWTACERKGLSAHTLMGAERLFLDHDCLYGYGHETPYAIAGRFSLICGNSRAGVPRIVDFDYARYIEDVYRYNYLSEPVLRLIDEGKVRELDGGIECKDLRDADGVRKGLALYMAVYSSANEQRLRECLQPVLWNG